MKDDDLPLGTGHIAGTTSTQSNRRLHITEGDSHDLDTIEKDILINAPAETVYRVTTEPDQIAQWFADAADLDPVPGGQATPTTLLTELSVTRQAVAKHLAVLARAGLVEGRRHGREVVTLSSSPLQIADREIITGPRWLKPGNSSPTRPRRLLVQGCRRHRPALWRGGHPDLYLPGERTSPAGCRRTLRCAPRSRHQEA